MKRAYVAGHLPLKAELIDQREFFDELIDATANLEVYKEKIKDSKLDSAWFMPTLQQKEALASSKMEGTQATLDGVLINQVQPNDKDENLNEVKNYYAATVRGCEYLEKHDFTDEFFYGIHKELMRGNVRKSQIIGKYRREQNFIGRNDTSHAITFIPPAPEDVPDLMKNLIDYMNHPKDSYRPLVRTAIIHAQFETIHPFMDGNGRTGRILIPMYMYYHKQIEFPCFFVSEALERDKMQYYTLLNDIRYKGSWNAWIRFFLSTVANQCSKYIGIITEINELYERHLEEALKQTRSSKIVDIMNALFQYPVATAKQIAGVTGISLSTVSRCLGTLAGNHILYSDNKKRNRTYYYYELLAILRD